jgi:enterochelin esterase-like enzyme
MRVIAVLLLIISGSAYAGGTLTPFIRISSVAMEYDIQYRVYVPEGVEAGDQLPVMFVTDGHDYIRNGRTPRVLDRLIRTRKIDTRRFIWWSERSLFRTLWVRHVFGYRHALTCELPG